MYTPEEAKTKGCPATQVPGHPHSTCIASACMAWRWAQKPNPDWKPSPFTFPHDPRAAAPTYIEDREHGYCGLAGRP